jgi:hypothetical protein
LAEADKGSGADASVDDTIYFFFFQKMNQDRLTQA